MALVMGFVHHVGRRQSQPLLAQAALGMQPTLAMLTAVVAILGQWHFRSPPLWTAGFLVATGMVFAWRAWRDQELRWIHSAMAIVGISLPYLGWSTCSDANSMATRWPSDWLSPPWPGFCWSG
ncbi:MAG: hypothetical protein CM1200mP2_16720 [Planctomycetaceae bacterium]|nr:MAG: hypothetical protein CM1200mP2_16720 [Planctomycetaceae bacterium]